MLALPPGWEVKRRIVKSFLVRGAKALAREDYELVLLTYHPNVEITNIGAAPIARPGRAVRRGPGRAASARPGPRFAVNAEKASSVYSATTERPGCAAIRGAALGELAGDRPAAILGALGGVDDAGDAVTT